MKTNIYLNGKKISKKQAIEKVGEERLKRMINEAKEEFKQDPYTDNSWFIGSGMMSIEFN